MCLLKKTTRPNEKHLCNPLSTGWLTNSAYYGFNSGESGFWWVGSKINSQWNLSKKKL